MLKKDKLYAELRKRIVDGLYPFDTKLPKELDFARQENVSFKTMRAALARLEQDRLIRRIPGKGTFVESSIAEKDADLGKILLLIPDFKGAPNAENIFNQHLILGVMEKAYLLNYEIEIALSDQVNLVYRKDVHCGIIWDRPEEHSYGTIEIFAAQGLPQVTVNRQIASVPSIACDYPAAVRQAVRYLQNIGHQFIGLVDFATDRVVKFQERHDAFCAQLAYKGIEEPAGYMVLHLYDSKTPFWLDIGKWFHSHPEITAVLVSNVFFKDFEEFLTNEQLNVPKELSVIQWGENRTYNRDSSHPYSILTDPRTEAGRLAVELTARRLNGESVDDENHLLDGELIVRKGCTLPRDFHKKKDEVNS